MTTTTEIALLPTDLSALDVCTDHACINATSHEDTCTCRCGSIGHGLAHRESRQRARAAFQHRSVGGFTPAMLTADDSAF